MKKKEKIFFILFCIVFFGLTCLAWFGPNKEFSQTERRQLAKFPQTTKQAVFSGTWMEKFETYALDQFPFREQMRTMKALNHKYVYHQKDNDGIYYVDGHISDMDPEVNKDVVNKGVNTINKWYEKHIKNTDVNVYASLIMDKNCFLADKNGYLAMDYNALETQFCKTINKNIEYIDIKNLLSIDDYYKTDTHWKQENIQDVAKELAHSMGVELKMEYEEKTIDAPFYGVYYGQLGLPVKPDKISYLYNDIFDDCKVFDHANQREIPVYDLELATGRDPYEMFLSGSLSVITIENNNATTKKELVIFRDSFGSSIAPLFIEGYKKITILDMRYLHESLIEKFVKFDKQDVLFLYSTSVMNNATSFK